MTALVTASGAFDNDPALTERFAAILAAGLCSCLYSWWKSRKRKADNTDTAIWALIALVGSMSIGWFLAPALADRDLFGTGIALPRLPIMTWLLAISGSPIIEWLLDGRAFKVAAKRLGLNLEDQA